MATRSVAFDHSAVRQLLPHRSALLLVDKVEAYYPEERRLVALKNVSQNDPFLQGHFPQFPIFPGVLIVEALLQASTILMHLDARFAEGMPEDDIAQLLRSFKPPPSVLAESRVKHMAPSYPGDQLRLEAQLTRTSGGIATFKVRALAGSGEVASQGRISVAVSPERLAAAAAEEETAGPVRELTDDTFHQAIVAGGAPAIVEFWAEWCPYARLVRPKLERLAARYGDRLLVARGDAERHPGVVEAVGLEYIPALILFRGGQPVRRLYGDRHLGELVAHVERSRILV